EVQRHLVRGTAAAGVRRRARAGDYCGRSARLPLPAGPDAVPAPAAGPDRVLALPAGAGGGQRAEPVGPGPGQRQRPPLPGVRLLRQHRAAGRPGGDPVTDSPLDPVTAVVASLAQVAVVVLVAPLLVGLMRQVRARMEGRVGAGVWQPWRDLRKLFRRQPVTPVGTTWAFRAAPLLLVATALVVAATIPLLTTHTVLDRVADLFAVVGLLTLGTVVLALAALNTGTAFGGMGASREVTVLALVEPTILVAVFALSARVGSTNLGQLVDAALHDPLRVVSPASLLAAAALLLVTSPEPARFPVANPPTHLDLTMRPEPWSRGYSGAASGWWG